MEVFETTKNKLDRELKEQEMDFLRWLYKKHLNELQRTTIKQDEFVK